MAHPWSHLTQRLSRWIDPQSLQTRLTAGVVLASLVGIGTMAAWMGWRTRQILLERHRHDAQIIADRFMEDVRHYTATMPADAALQKVIDHRTTGDLALWVTTSDGELLAQSETLDMGSWQTSGVAAQILQQDLPPGLMFKTVQGWQFVLCTEDLDLPGLPVGTLTIANDITADYQGLRRLLRMLLLTSLGMVTVLAVAFALYIRRTLSPIRQLNQLASQVTAETLGDHQLCLQAAPTEVQELARTYNLMLSRLSRAWRQQKRFVNDISHELRTPLSLVQGYLEGTLRRGDNLTPPQRQGLEIAAVETHRTVHLLTELLELARLDNGQMPLTLEPTDLQVVLKDAIAMVEGDYATGGDIADGLASNPMVPVSMEASRIVLTTESPPPVARVDRYKLRTVLVELLDNALRYSDSKYPVQVKLFSHSGQATIQVRDQGQGIDTPAQADVFDPFYRVDDNRSRSTGGTGLGLTLVRSLIEAMEGQVSVCSQPGQGSVFTITLPM